MSDLKQYVQDAIRTESKIDNITTDQFNLVELLKAYVAIGNLLDDIKKNTFYNKPIDPIKWDANRLTAIQHISKVDKFNKLPIIPLTSIDPRLFHAIIGIATESTELVEAILKALSTNSDIDHVNVLEEFGDIFWYTAIAIDSTNADWDSILATNIAKLKKRYPEKFTSDDAINRDLESERKILEREKFQVRTAQQVLDNLHDY